MRTELHIELTSDELSDVAGGFTSQDAARLVLNVCAAIPLVNVCVAAGKAVGNAQNSLEGKPQVL
jgi:hypothetical protein